MTLPPVNFNRQLKTLQHHRRYATYAALACGGVAVLLAVLGWLFPPERVYVPDALLATLPVHGYQEIYRDKGYGLIGMVITWSAPILAGLGLGWWLARRFNKSPGAWRTRAVSLLTWSSLLCFTILVLHQGVPMALRWRGHSNISQATFLQSIQRATFDDAHEWLLNHRLLGVDGSHFVLAQLALLENRPFSADFWAAAAGDAVEAEAALGRGIDAEYGGLRALAAVETAAYDEVRTPAARPYAGVSLAGKISRLWILAGLVLLLAIGFARMRVVLTRRLASIRAMLNSTQRALPDPATGDEAPIVGDGVVRAKAP